MPKVSVLVPVYNVEKYLKCALDSLLAQTLVDIEIILINDGSSDSSFSIMQEYANNDKRIKIIDKPNSGYGHSMNLGIKAASGDYIAILEPDDFIEPNMYEELYNAALKYPSINLFKSDWYLYDSSSNQAKKAGKIKKEGIVNIEDNQKLLRIQAIWSGLYKRSFLLENKINFLETPGASYQDTSFAFKALSIAGNVYLTKKAYLYYRQDNANSSVHSGGKVYFICDEHEEIARFLNLNPKLKEKFLTSHTIGRYFAYKGTAMRIDAQFKDEFLLKFQETFAEYVNNGEITKEFYRKINKKEFNILLSDLKKYRKFIDSEEKKLKQRRKRRKLFSVRINSSRTSITVFGKQILQFEY